MVFSKIVKRNHFDTEFGSKKHQTLFENKTSDTRLLGFTRTPVPLQDLSPEDPRSRFISFKLGVQVVSKRPHTNRRPTKGLSGYGVLSHTMRCG